jgi:hypothetical protein
VTVIPAQDEKKNSLQSKQIERMTVWDDFGFIDKVAVTRSVLQIPHILVDSSEKPNESTIAVLGHSHSEGLNVCRNSYYNGIQ